MVAIVVVVVNVVVVARLVVNIIFSCGQSEAPKAENFVLHVVVVVVDVVVVALFVVTDHISLVVVNKY